MTSRLADIVISTSNKPAIFYGSRDKRMKTAYRFLFFLTAVWSTNVAIAGNFDVEIHCFPKRGRSDREKGFGWRR